METPKGFALRNTTRRPLNSACRPNLTRNPQLATLRRPGALPRSGSGAAPFPPQTIRALTAAAQLERLSAKQAFTLGHKMGQSF